MSASYTVFASLLRGVNVGGRTNLGMPALAKVYEDLGLADVRTILRSGNVVFRGRKTAKQIEDAIEKRFAFRPKVFLRNGAELREAIAANPFADAARDDPGHLLIMFFDQRPDLSALDAYRGPERFRLVGRDLYVHYTQGIGRSKLNPLLDRKVEARGTARNWNTIGKIIGAMG
ncbi:MAG: DUF1697 domain-containing protein [Myxococcales bacterium]|nr:DUF1697 domain-containing protein [Myxococcales bacterium]